MPFAFLLLILGFFLVIKGADFLVDGGSALAKKLHVSDLVIGLTVVAFGTSLPELIVNIFASGKGNTEIAIGNVLGSNTANILLILGLSAAIYPLEVGKGTVWKEIPLSLLAVLVLAVMSNDWINSEQTSSLTRSDGLILISFFSIFLYYTASIARTPQSLNVIEVKRELSVNRSIIFILFGLLLLIAGGKFIVDNAVFIASGLGLSETVIGLTIVAMGTSVPELATSVMAAIKKNPEIAVGNIVGSNIFNIFFILGISSIIKPLPVVQGANVDIGVSVIAALVLFLCMFTGKQRVLDRWEGWALVSSYLLYIVYSVIHK
jgi:cation:H+ antiporter